MQSLKRAAYNPKWTLFFGSTNDFMSHLQHIYGNATSAAHEIQYPEAEGWQVLRSALAAHGSKVLHILSLHTEGSHNTSLLCVYSFVSRVLRCCVLYLQHMGVRCCMFYPYTQRAATILANNVNALFVKGCRVLHSALAAHGSKVLHVLSLNTKGSYIIG